MKIISYNINKCTQEKIDHLLSMDGDFYIVPEMSEPSLISIPNGYKAEWIGDYASKGLGVIWKDELHVEKLIEKVKQNYFIPLLVDGKLMIAAWPTKQGASKTLSYPKIAMLTFEQLSEYIDKYPTLISGDFNCYVGQSGETKAYSTVSLDGFLGKHGLRSLYHSINHEKLGKEKVCTYHHLFKGDANMRFFIDYTYTNIPVKNFMIKEWEPEISDHQAQIIFL